MKITLFEISGYWRLFLRGITYVKYIPLSNVLVILGTNGSGKSSLLEEYSINAADPMFYNQGGFKIVEAEHRGSKFIFNSQISTKGNTFSILKDGVELNKSLGITGYREVLKKEFRMTKQVHDILIGKRNFHEMGSEERKNWMVNLSGVDFTYALSFFAKAKEAHRDTVGAIRTIHTRLSAESAKVVDDKELEALEVEFKLLQKTLYYFLETKGNKQHKVLNNELGERQSIQQMKELVKEARLLKQKFLSSNNTAITEYTTLSSKTGLSFEQLKQKDLLEIARLDAQIEQIYKEEEKLQSNIAKLRHLNVEDREQIITARNVTSQELIQIENSIQIKSLLELIKDSNDAWYAQKSYESSCSSLKSIFSLLRSNENDKYTPKVYRLATENLTTAKGTLLMLEAELQKLFEKKTELEHLKQHSRSQCPECSHIWYKGYNEVEHQNVLRKQAALIEDKKLIDAKIEQLNSFINECFEYLSNYKNYSDIRNTLHKSLQLLLEKDSVVKNSPDKAYKLLELYNQELQLVIKYYACKVALDNIDSILKEKESNEITSVKELSSSIDGLSEILYNLTTEKSSLVKRVASYENHLNIKISASAIAANVKAIVSQHLGRKQSELEVIQNNYYRDVISTISLRMNQIEKDKSQTQYQKNLVKDLNDQLEELTLKEKSYSLILESLSPKTGLIAKGLSNFINHLVDNMNSFIKSYWTYPLEILPVDISNSIDLDFKFEVLVNGERVIPDAREGSGAIREILNLAFKLEAAKLLDLSDFAVYLDEFGVKMDAAHRDLAYSGLMRLIDESSFSQLVVVSHYEQGYSGLNNADFIVLCDKNIVLPEFARDHACVSFNK